MIGESHSTTQQPLRSSHNRGAGKEPSREFLPVLSRAILTESRSVLRASPGENLSSKCSARPIRQRRPQTTEPTRRPSVGRSEQQLSATATSGQAHPQFQTLEILDRVRDEFHFLKHMYSAYDELSKENDEIYRHYLMFFEMSQYLEAQLIQQVEVNNRCNALLKTYVQQLPPATQKVVQIEMDQLAILTSANVPPHIRAVHLAKRPSQPSPLKPVYIPTANIHAKARSQESTCQFQQECTSKPSPIRSTLKSAPTESSLLKPTANPTLLAPFSSSCSSISFTASSSASILSSPRSESSARVQLPPIRDAFKATVSLMDDDEAEAAKIEPMLRAASEPSVSICKYESDSVDDRPIAKKRKMEEPFDRVDRSRSGPLNAQNEPPSTFLPPLTKSTLHQPQNNTQHGPLTHLHPPANRRFSAPHIYAPRTKSSTYLDSYRISTKPTESAQKDRNGHTNAESTAAHPFRQVARLKLVESLPHGDVICAIAIGGYNASTVYTGGNGVVKVWQNPDGGSRTCVSQLPSLDSYIRACKTSADGKLLAVAGESNQIVVWDLVANSRQIRNRLTSPATAAYTLCLSPDSRLLFSGGSDGDVNVFDLVSDRQVRKLRGHFQGATCMELTSDDGKLITGSLDKTVRIWDLGMGATVSRHALPSQIYSLGIGLSGTCASIAVGLENSDVNLIPLVQSSSTTASVGDYPLRSPVRAHDGSVLALKFHPRQKNIFVSAGKDGKLVAWKTDPILSSSANPIFHLYENDSILCCDISESHVLIGSDERCARVYEICGP